jgi:hypothetical protein
MIALKPITLESLDSFRKVRLRALRDSPSAFGSTYAKESQLSNLDWENRATQWNSGRSVAFLAWDGDDAYPNGPALVEFEMMRSISPPRLAGT